MDAGSRTVIIGDSNAPVDFESLGTVISRTNHRNHFPPEKALYWAVATPQMPPTFDAPRIVSLGSGIAWLAVGLIPVVRTRLASRLERGLAATAFFLAGWAFLDALYPVLSGPSTAFRWRSIGTLGILLVAVALSLSANIDETLTSTFDELWSASFLIVPAALILAAILPLSRDDWNRAFRGASAIQERVTAIYMFYRTGEPLVALASSRNLPIGAEQLEGLLAVVGNFVETSVPLSAGYAVTAMRYEGLGIVAVRGEFVIVAAVYDGPVYDALRGELTRALKAFEERSRRQLGTWEDATSVAEVAANELSNFLEHPERTVPPRLPKVSPSDVKPRKAS